MHTGMVDFSLRARKNPDVSFDSDRIVALARSESLRNPASATDVQEHIRNAAIVGIMNNLSSHTVRKLQYD